MYILCFVLDVFPYHIFFSQQNIYRTKKAIKKPLVRTSVLDVLLVAKSYITRYGNPPTALAFGDNKRYQKANELGYHSKTNLVTNYWLHGLLGCNILTV